MKRPVTLWIIAIVVTLTAVVYQRLTGPTHPVSGVATIAGQDVAYRLIRTHDTTRDAPLEFTVYDTTVSGEMRWRRYKSHDEWQTATMTRKDDRLTIAIPKQPSAGKVMYEITLVSSAGERVSLTDEPVVIRFKGPVPVVVLVPHVILMFLAILWAFRAGLEAIVGGNRLLRHALVTTACLFMGGLILGPLVQKYAFDAYWTGWPWGHDLTDTKTAVAFLFWIVALIGFRKQGRPRFLVIAAVLVTLAVYLIPHSAWGSEIDYTETETSQAVSTPAPE